MPQERRGGEFSHLSGESEGGPVLSAVQLITIIMSPIPGLILRNVMRNSTQGKLLDEGKEGQPIKNDCKLRPSCL